MAEPPILHVIFDALVARGWKITGEGLFVDPEDNQYGTVEAAITAQCFREIAAQPPTEGKP